MDLIEKYGLDKKKWTYKGFHGVLHTFFPVAENPLKSLKDNYGNSFSLTLFFVEKDYVHWYWNDEDMFRLGQSVVDKVNKDPNFLDWLVKTWKRKAKDFENSYSKIDTDYLAKLGDKKLLDSYKKFYDCYIDEYSLAIGLQDPFSMHAEVFLEPPFKKVIKEDFNSNFVVLMSPITDSFINQEMKDRYRMLIEVYNNQEILKMFAENNDVASIVGKLKSSQRSFYNKLSNHVLKYHWIQNNYAKTPYLDENYFAGQLKDMLMKKVEPMNSIEEIDHALLETQKKKPELIKKLKLGKDLQNLIKIVEVFAAMQDERKKYVLLSNYYQRLFRDEIGKRLGLSHSEMDYSIYPELEDMLLKKKVNKDKLKQRREFSICIEDFNGYEIISGDEARSIYDKVFNKEKKQEEIIKGQIASLGKIYGPVKIIRKIHDIENMEKGDILVASMTRPEMVVAMQRASGIITDEGGVTCHAAIVSREMKIPCVIGTKVATRVLHDGDLVELNAEKGFVRKITAEEYQKIKQKS